MKPATSTKILLLTVIVVLFNSATTAYAQDRSTRDTEKKADELFEKGAYTEAKKLYSNLVALYPKEPTYNYRYGACILYSEPDKSKALKYLKYAAATADPPVEAYYFAGLGYHYNYRFRDAAKYYTKFKAVAKNRDLKNHPVDRQIRMAENGQQLLRNISEPRVKNQTQTSAADFHLSYNFPGSDYKFLRMLSEFRTKTDEKQNYYGLMYKHANHDEIWFSSHGNDESSGTAIYRVKIDENGNFEKAEKLPAAVNSKFDEAYPFFNYTTNTLYFASKGHSSMGGFDIFKIDYDPVTDTWGTAQNMDYAFNTPDDDFLYAETQNTAFFTSSRNNNEGRVTVYEINPANSELQTALIAGTFRRELYKQAEITVTKLPEKEVIGTFISNEEDGRYMIPLPGNSKYEFSVKPKGSSTSHLGEVRIPKINNASPLLQTMSVIKNGENEQLVINNQFNNSNIDEELKAAYFAKMANLQKTTSAQKSIAQTDEQIITKLQQAVQYHENRKKELSEEAQKATAVAGTHLETALELKTKVEKDPDNQDLKQQYTEVLAQSDAAAHYAMHLEKEAETENQKTRDLNEKLKRAKEFADRGERDKTTEIFLNYQDQYSKKGEKSPGDQAYYNYLETAENYEAKAAANRKEISALRSEKTDLKEQITFLNGEKNRTRKKSDKEDIQAEIERITQDLEFLEEKVAKLQQKENQLNVEAEHMTLRAEVVKNMRDEIHNTQTQTSLASAAKILGTTEIEIRNEITTKKDHEFKREEIDELAVHRHPENTLGDTIGQNPKPDEKQTADEVNEPAEQLTEESTKEPGTTDEYTETITKTEETEKTPEDTETVENRESTTSPDENTEMNEFQKLRAERKIMREQDQNSDADDTSPAIENQDAPNKNEEQGEITTSTGTGEKSDDEEFEFPTETETETETELATNPETEITEEPENTKLTEQTPNEQPIDTQPEPEYQKPEYERFFNEAEEQVNRIENTSARSLALLELKKQRLEKTEREVELLEEKKATADESQQKIIEERLTQLEKQKTLLNTAIEDEEREFESGRKRNKDFSPGEEFENSFTIQDIEDKFFFEYETLNEENPREALQAAVNITEKYIAELSGIREKLENRLESLPKDNKNYDKIVAEIDYIDEVTELKQNQLDYNQEILSLAETPQYTDDVEVNLPRARQELAVESQQTSSQDDEPQEEAATAREPDTSRAKTGDREAKETAPEPETEAPAKRIAEFQKQYKTSQTRLNTARAALEEAESELNNAKRRKRKQAEMNVNNAQAEVKSAQLDVYMDSLLLSNVQKIQDGEDFEIKPSKQFADSAKANEKKSSTAYNQGVALREAENEDAALEKMNASRMHSKKARKYSALAQTIAELEETTGVKEEKRQPAPTLPDQRLIAFESDKNLSPDERERTANQEEYREYQKAQTRFSLKLRQASVMYEDAREMELKGARLNAAVRNKKQEDASEAEIAAIQEEADYLLNKAEEQKKNAENSRKAAIVEYNQAREQLIKSSSDQKPQMLALAREHDQPFEDLVRTPLPALNSDESFAELDAEERDSRQTSTAERDEDRSEKAPETPDLITDSRRTDSPDTTPVREFPETEDINDEPARPTDLTRTARAAASGFTLEPDETASRANPVNFIPDGDDITYRVQVAAFRERVNEDYFPFSPMAGEQLPNGIIRYLAGNFDNRNEAEQTRDQIRAAGFNDAFVVAYRGNSKITLAEAASSTHTTASSKDTEEVNMQARENLNRASEITLNANTIVPEVVNNPELIQITDVESRAQLFFTVQIGAFSNQTPVSDLPAFSPLNRDDLGTGIVRYSTGIFARLPDAVESKNTIRSTVPDAFVTAYYKGKRISVERALELGSDQKTDTPETETQQPRPRETTAEEKMTQQSAETTPEQDHQKETQRTPEAPKGISPGQFTVEVGPYEGKVPVNEARQILQLSSMGVNIQKTGDATYYQIGIFDGEEEAEKLAKDLRRKGIREARTIAYKK